MDGPIALLARQIPSLIDASKSDSTLRKYKTYFSKFQNWCKMYDLDSLPASASTVSLYISFLVQANSSSSVLTATIYAIQWYHDKNLFPNPCYEKLVKLTAEGGRRILAKPFVNKKEPITIDIIEKIFKSKNDMDNLCHLRTRLICVLGYAGFFRASELCSIKSSDIKFHDEYVEIKIRSSKTDIYRRGNSVHIAKSNSPFCPYQCLKDYLRLADIRTHADEFIFRSVRFFRNSRSYKLSLADKPLSYTSMREIFLRALSEVGEEPRKFGLHSLRSGGATAAANADIPDRLFKAHGRWRSETAKDGYVKDNINNFLSVSKNLGL